MSQSELVRMALVAGANVAGGVTLDSAIDGAVGYAAGWTTTGAVLGLAVVIFAARWQLLPLRTATIDGRHR